MPRQPATWQLGTEKLGQQINRKGLNMKLRYQFHGRAQILHALLAINFEKKMAFYLRTQIIFTDFEQHILKRIFVRMAFGLFHKFIFRVHFGFKSK